MPEVQITRSEIIVVNEVGQNTYGDLTFTDKEGGQYKVHNKRKQYFDKTIIPGAAVQLNYASAYGKEYIYSAVLVKDELPPLVKGEKPKTVEIPKKSAIQEDIRENMEWKQKNIEKSFWWKEVGENFRAGLFKKDEGNGALLWRAYIVQMLSSLEITIKGKED